jgi:hypothetical protein
MSAHSFFKHSRFILIAFLCCLAGQLPGAEAGGKASNRLIVVAPLAFHSALKDFVAHKSKLLPTELRSLEEILGSSKGVDDPEKLKRYLYEEWRRGGLGYALLVGDVDVLPVRFMVLDRVTPAAFDYAFYPCDLYYSDLAKEDGSFDDWNANKEGFHAGYFGEVRGEKNKQDPINFDQVDYRPDIAVGRWPVSTAEEARLVAAKTIAYEDGVLTKSNSQSRRAAFVATPGWVDCRPLMNRLGSSLTNGWEIEKRYYANSPDQAHTPPPNHKEVRGLFNDGAGLIVHAGHGESDGWDQCFSVNDLAGITNSSKLPVVISAGCSTAYFAPLPPYQGYVDVDGKEHTGTDAKEVFTAPPPPPAPYQRGRFNPTGLGEQILKRNSDGAVAYIGCNTGSQPCGLTLMEGFVYALAEAATPRLGDCWASAIRHYYEVEHLDTLKPNADWYPPSIFFQGMKFMLFGDPSLRMPANSAHATAASQSAGAASPSSPEKKLIEFGWDEPDPAFMRQHVAEMEKTPFDGCVFHMDYNKADGAKGSFTWDCWGTNRFKIEDLKAALDDLKATQFDRFKHNFLRFNTTPANLDWFDDHGAVLNNARLAARVAREGNCPGLLFDIEQYNAPLFNYHKQRDAASKSWDVYAAQVRLRGRQVIESFQQGYPDLTVFLTFGYSLPWTQCKGNKDKLADANYGLLAPFLDGLVEGAKGKTKLVDGYELAYAYKTMAQYKEGYATVHEKLLPIVADPANYKTVFQCAFGVWMDRDWRKLGWETNDFSKNYFSPEAFTASVRSAWKTTDEYVWIYTETPRWWSNEGVAVKLPPAYDAAVREARAGTGN